MRYYNSLGSINKYTYQTYYIKTDNPYTPYRHEIEIWYKGAILTRATEYGEFDHTFDLEALAKRADTVLKDLRA